MNPTDTGIGRLRDGHRRVAGTHAAAPARTRASRALWIVALLMLAGAGIAPTLLNGYQVFVLSLALCYMVATIGLNISLGWTGMLVFSGSAFFGIGAFVAGRAASLGVPAELALLAALVVGAVVGLAYGAMTVKLNRYYFAITGIALMFILNFFYRNFPDITGGYSGFSIPYPRFLTLGGSALFSQQGLYYVGVIMVVLAYLGARYLERSPLGRGWRVVSQNPDIASALGVNVRRSKMLSFGISMSFISFGGAWFGYLSFRFLPETYMFTDLLFIFLVLIVGGVGSINGMIVGSFFLVLLREYLRGFPGLSELIYGVLLLLVVLFFSEGVYGALRSRFPSLREGVL